GKSKDIEDAVSAADKARTAFMRSEHVVSDKQILAAVLQRFYTDIDQNQHPIGFYSSLKKDFGDLNDPVTYKKYADYLFDASFLLDSLRWKSFVKNPDGAVLQSDPAYGAASAFLKNFQGKYLPLLQQFNEKNNEAGRLYLEGILLMDTVKAKKLYPDATMTMRVSFGSVKGYEPKDAVIYDYATTMKGVLEKYKAGDYEFDLDPKTRELALKKDFGQYIDKQRKDLVVNFITNNDITGGNSGSPVIDANGNLIGLAFDGNYEALSHKILFDNAYNRTICVDIRYVLWCIDKIGGAANLIRELKIVK
ncbi:MAG: S46 family peptidase, partial [Chitinophagaceae bacterium]|nr:S46 family peptidase [Chitinophagaceae bacterium]